MKNNKIKLLTKLSLVVLMMSPVSTVISAKTSSDYGSAVVMAPTATDTNKDGDNSQITTSDDNSTDASKDNGTVVSDTPNADVSTDKNTNSKKTASNKSKSVAPKVDAPTADSYTNDNPKIDDQRGLAKWKNYKGPLAKYMTHIYKGKAIAGVDAKKNSTNNALYKVFLKFNFVNKEGQMDTGIAKRFNYNVDTGKSIKPTAVDTTKPIPVTETDKSGSNAKLETSYKPATGSDDPWKEGTLHFKYTNMINASTGWDGSQNAGLITQIKRGLGFGAIIDLPKNVTYDQIINGFENGQLVISTPGVTWYDNVSKDTLEKIGQSPDPNNKNLNRWQLTDSTKYFSPVKGDSHKMYFSMHKFLVDADKDLSNNTPDQTVQPYTTAFFFYVVMAIVNHMGTGDPGPTFTNVPITFETDINITKAIPEGIIAASDGYTTDATDEAEVTKQSTKRLPPTPDALLHMGVKFYSYDQINATSNYDDEWGIKDGTSDPYDARSDLQTWKNFIRPVDPDTGAALKYDSSKDAYVYDKKVVTSGKLKALDFTKVWDIYANKAATDPQELATDKSISELKTGGGTITYSSKTKDLKPVKIYFSNVSEEAINHKPIVKDVKLDPITMVEKSEKDIAVSGKYSDEDTSDKISLEYQIDDGALKDVEGYQNVSKKQAKAMAAKYEKKLKKQQAKAAKEIAAHKKALAAKPSVVKKEKILTNNIIGGIQQPSVGENDSLVIADDGGQLTYSISTEKSGNPNQTAVGDEVTVTTKVLAEKPQNTKINGQDVYIKLLNSAFIFPFNDKLGTNGKPELEPMNNGDGEAGLYSSDGKQIAPITTWKNGDGSFDDGAYGMNGFWNGQIGEYIGAIKDYSIKGSTTYENDAFETIYSDTQFKHYNQNWGDGKIVNYPNSGGNATGGVPNTKNGVPTSATYVAFKNKMKATDYLQFSYKYKVGEGADGVSPSELRFYAGINDYSTSINGQYMFGYYIGTDLPGETINSIAVNPDQTEYDAEVTQANLSSYSQAMTGTYTDTSGTTPTIQYEVNSSNEKPGSNAKAVTVDGTKKTYSANVTSGNWKFGVNTVRFFLTAKNGKVTYADVTVNLTEKIDPDKDFNFTIPASEIKALDDKEVGKHTVHVYAVDDKGAKSDDVKDVSTGDFEVTPIPNTAPVVEDIKDKSNSSSSDIRYQTENPLDLTINWHDKESTTFTGEYTITDTDGNEAASGAIGESHFTNNPGSTNHSTFSIPAVNLQKLKASTTYHVTVKITDDGGLTSSETKYYTIYVGAANQAPVINSIVDDNGKSITPSFEVGKPLSLHLNWSDADSKSFTAQYKISGMGGSDGTVATGDIDPDTLINDPGTNNITDFVIPSTDTSKMIAGNSYKVTVILKDDGGATDDSESIAYQILIAADPKPSLELPDKLSFKEVTVGSTRQLDLRDAGWDKVKNSDSDKLSVTVQQTAPWTADGLSTSLSPIEMVSSDDEFSSNYGTPIDKAAVPVKFKADGTLDWSDKFGLFQPIGTGDLAGSYSTELTWTTTDAPK